MSNAASKTVVVKKADPIISPWSFRELRLREAMVARLNDFQPEGHCDETQLANIRAFVLAEISTLPADVNAVEVLIETQIGPGARQANVIVFPKKL